MSIFDVTKRGDALSLKKLLTQPFDIDERDKDGMTPLCIAAWDGHLECLKLILESGANIRDDHNLCALNFAAKQGHLECVRELLKYDVYIEKSSGFDRNTPLQLAAENGHSEIVKELLFPIGRKGANVNALGYFCFTPLHYAAENGHLNCIVELLKSPDINIDEIDNIGRSPLYVASREGHVDCVKKLLESGARTYTDQDGDPMHIGESEEIIKIFQDHENFPHSKIAL